MLRNDMLALSLSLGFVASMANGCTGLPAPKNADERRAAAQIQIFDGPPPPGSRILKEVEVILCPEQSGASINPAAARNPLQLQAVRAGANGLANILCSDAGTSWAHNCFNSVRCAGDAIIVGG